MLYCISQHWVPDFTVYPVWPKISKLHQTRISLGWKNFFLGGVALFCCHRKTNRRTKLWNIKEADWILMRNATQILLQLSRRPWVCNSLNTSCALIQAFTDAVYQLHITTCSSEILSHIIVLHILIALCSCRCMLHKCFHRKKWRNQ